MGKLLTYEGYSMRDARQDCCGRHAAIAPVFDAAIELDDEALAEFDLDTLQEAIDALSLCDRFGCESHYGCRAAKDALSQAWEREQERLAELDRDDFDAHQHGGACGCCECI